MLCTRRAILAAAAPVWAAVRPAAVKHVVVYKEAGRYGGWPATYGAWSWGSEIVVGFSSSTFKLAAPNRHQTDTTQPEVPMIARTLDGGETWLIEAPKSLLPPEQGGASVRELDAPMDFTRPGFAMTLRSKGVPGGASRLSYSYDRGRTWTGPFSFPMLGQKWVAARTDYLVNGPNDAHVFLTGPKSGGREGRVFCARTTDGGLTWKFVSWIGDEPPGFSIMPSTVRLSRAELLTATRVRLDANNTAIELFRSTDNGETWQAAGTPAPMPGDSSGGNPPSLIRLRDGRLCLTYGKRTAPYTIAARLSKDRGRTWSDEIVLRNDGASFEVGYVRSAQRPDGKVTVVYYFAEQPQTERIIAATIWDPHK